MTSRCLLQIFFSQPRQHFLQTSSPSVFHGLSFRYCTSTLHCQCFADSFLEPGQRSNISPPPAKLALLLSTLLAGRGSRCAQSGRKVCARRTHVGDCPETHLSQIFFTEPHTKSLPPPSASVRALLDASNPRSSTPPTAPTSDRRHRHLV